MIWNGRRWVVRIVCLAALVLAASSGTVPSGAAAEAPAGPRLAVIKWTLEPFALQLLTVSPSGSEPQQIAIGARQGHPLPMPLDAPSWSPDGSLIAFEGVTGKLLGSQGRSEIYVAAPDGTGMHAVPNTRGGRDPVFAPDGHTLAFSRERNRPPGSRARTAAGGYSSTAVLAVDLQTGALRQITPWRNGLSSIPTSFTPDGSLMAIARQHGERDPEVVALRMDGTGSTVLARHATDGVYSPDGSRMALVRIHRRKFGQRGGAGTKGFETTTDLFVMRTDGTESRRLTRSARQLEVWPAWDPSGERLAYVRFQGGSELGFLGFGDAIMEINADGTCQRLLLSGRLAAFYGPAWQPGPSRAVGRIICS